MSPHKGSRVSLRAAQRGFSVMLMLGIIVLMGGMLAYAVSFTSGMNHSVAQEAGVLRVTQAANAGLEWARYRVRVSAGGPCWAASTNLTIPLSSGAVPVTVLCMRAQYPEGTANRTIYQLSATACSPAAAGGACPNLAGAANYVQRTVTGIAER
jgi:MSHA biogenesis protein MshP